MEAKEAEENKGDEFSGFLERWNALQTALTLFDWDNETLAQMCIRDSLRPCLIQRLEVLNFSAFISERKERRRGTALKAHPPAICFPDIPHRKGGIYILHKTEDVLRRRFPERG